MKTKLLILLLVCCMLEGCAKEENLIETALDWDIKEGHTLELKENSIFYETKPQYYFMVRISREDYLAFNTKKITISLED